MPHRRAVGSNFSISHALGTRSSGAFTVRRHVPVYAGNAAQTEASVVPNRPMRHEGDQQEAATDIDPGRTQMGRPRFARLHASIAECPMEWARQHPRSVVIRPGEREGLVAKLVNASFSARMPWLGGVAFALLAAAIISTVALVQSGRSPPAGEARSAGLLTAGHERGVARPGPPEAPASAPAGREGGTIDTAVAPGGAAPVVEIALLGPVLASAGEAQEVAAKLPMRTAAVPAAAVQAGANAPPR
jgi:hypothetical protein